MNTCVFIDWENIENTVKQFGSILDYDEFAKVIRKIATTNGTKLVDIRAYGDFDRGVSGLMSRLINLNITPHHVVTKNSQEYLKSSADIELSLDVLEISYKYPHITDYIFISGDSDLRYVAKRLLLQGKNIRVVGFEQQTSQRMKDMANEFIALDMYTSIMRKVTKSDKEKLALSLMFDKNVHTVINYIDRLEKSNRQFVGLNYLRNKLIDQYNEIATNISDALTLCIDSELLTIYSVPNPNDTKNPTRACRLNNENQVVRQILNGVK